MPVLKSKGSRSPIGLGLGSGFGSGRSGTTSRLHGEPAAAPVAPARLPDSANFFELTERFPDEKSAEQYFTQKRWPDGPICTACKSKDVYDCHSKRKHTQWKCRGCGKQFTVTSGTVMEHTMIPLCRLLCSAQSRRRPASRSPRSGRSRTSS